MLGHLEVEAVLAASRRPDVMAAIRRLYHALDAVVAAHRPVCRMRGLCCRFETSGHHLFATTLEFAYLLGARPAKPLPPNGSRCPYQAGQLCTVRAHRPVGCRVFFCEQRSADWQERLSERVLRLVRRMHINLCAPYGYCDWMVGLERLGRHSTLGETLSRNNVPHFLFT